jgi:hypothetical protein
VCVGAFGNTVAVAEDQYSDAFIIACNHFDPQGVKGLRMWCDEMRFTHAALSLASKTVPELSALHIRTGERNAWTGELRQLVSLQVHRPSGQPRDGEADWDFIENFAKRFLSGCRGEHVTKQHDGLKGAWGTELTSTWWLCDGASSAQAGTGCKDTAAALWLCAAGIQSACVESSETDSRAKTGRLFLNFESAVDPRYEAARIMALSGYEKIFGAAQLKPFAPTLVGGGDEIRVVESEDNAGFAGITLLYSHGWGDCPAGCLQRHWWKVRIKARGVLPGGAWELVVDAVEESGDVLPARVRAALCAGVSRD